MLEQNFAVFVAVHKDLFIEGSAGEKGQGFVEGWLDMQYFIVAFLQDYFSFC